MQTQRRPWTRSPVRRLAFYAICAGIVGAGILAQGCDPAATGRPAPSTPLARMQLDARLDTRVAAALAVRAALPGGTKHALTVPDPVRVTVTVEAPDIGQLTASVTLPAASVEVLVPRGASRLVTLRYFDSSGNILGFGQTVTDLTLDVQTVVISVVSALPGITIENTSAPAAAVRGTLLDVSSRIQNAGSSAIRVDQAGHRFRLRPTLTELTSNFVDAGVSPALPITINAGDAANYTHSSTIGLSTPPGIYQVDGVILGLRGAETFGLRVSTAPGTLRVVRDRDLTAFAGDGTAASLGDGGQATVAGVKAPVGLAFGPGGEVYISTDETIRRVATDGTITTLAGTPGVPGSGNGPSPPALFNDPKGLAYRSVGAQVLVADRGNNLIRAVNTSTGAVSTVAGGAGGFADNVAATATSCDAPEDVLAVPASSDFFYADTRSHIVRRVTAGTVRTFAGQVDAPGASGDGGSALAATLEEPRALAFDLTGDLLIGAGAANGVPNRGVVRRVDSAGVITTVAGTTDPVAGIKDGVAATSSALEEVHGVAVDPVGNIFISTQGPTANSGVVRLVTPEGVILTVAGGAANQGFGRPATGFALDFPERIIRVPGQDELLLALFGENRVKGLR